MNVGEAITIVLPTGYSPPAAGDEWEVAGATYQVVKCERRQDGLLKVSLLKV
jgi:hypothetical protein